MSNTREPSSTVARAHTRVQPGRLERGKSTAVASNVEYRLGKLEKYGLFSGDWLDCGCADGGYSIPIRQRGARSVTGIDVEADRIEQAKQRAAEANLSGMDFRIAATEHLPFGDQSFDVTILNEVFEHVADEHQSLLELYRVLRPGGTLVIMSPNRYFPFEGHGMLWGPLRTGNPVPLLPWLPMRWVAHTMTARNYWPHELRDQVLDAGFTLIDLTSVFPVFEVYPWLPSFIIRWYRTNINVIDQLPIVRKFGVSTLVIARRPAAASA